MRKRIIAITMAVIVSFMSIAPYYTPVQGAQLFTPIIEGLANYFGSVIGGLIWDGLKPVSLNENEGFYLSIRNTILNALSDGNIYQDEQDVYHFSPEFTNNFYNGLNRYDVNNGIYVKTNYSGFDDLKSNAYVNAGYVSFVDLMYSTFRDSNRKYIFLACQQPVGSEMDILTDFAVYDITSIYNNFYLVPYNGYLLFCDGTTSEALSVRCTYGACRYYSKSSTYNFTENGTSNRLTLPVRVYSNYYVEPVHDFDTARDFNNTSIYSNCPLVFAATNLDGNNYFKNNGIVNSSATINYVNTYNEFPPVSQDVITNNDWTNIYNNYINNVNQEIHEGITIDELNEIMGTYAASIINAINNGNGQNIENEIEVTNNWMSRIYRRLGVIYDLLSAWRSDGASDGGGGSGTDLSNVEKELSSIKTQLFTIQNSVDSAGNLIYSLSDIEASQLEYLEYLYDYVVDLYKAVLQISLRSDGTNSYTYNIYNNFTKAKDADLTIMYTHGDTLANLLSEAVPLCYIIGIGTALSLLEATPTRPDYHIPVKSTALGIDEEIDLTLPTSFDSVQSVLHALLDIAFILMLIWLSFKIIKFVSGIFS